MNATSITRSRRSDWSPESNRILSSIESILQADSEADEPTALLTPGEDKTEQMSISALTTETPPTVHHVLRNRPMLPPPLPARARTVAEIPANTNGLPGSARALAPSQPPLCPWANGPVRDSRMDTRLLTFSPEFLAAVRSIAPKPRRSKLVYVVVGAVAMLVGALGADQPTRDFLLDRVQVAMGAQQHAPAAAQAMMGSTLESR